MAVNVYSKTESEISLNLKADKTDTYPKAEVNVAIGILQAGIDRRVLSNAVDIQSKFKINAISIDIFRIQRVDGTSLYDALELSFDMAYKTSILKNKIMLIFQAL